MSGADEISPGVRWLADQIKRDMADLKTDLSKDIRDLRKDVSEVKDSLAETREEMAASKGEIKEFQNLCFQRGEDYRVFKAKVEEHGEFIAAVKGQGKAFGVVVPAAGSVFGAIGLEWLKRKMGWG
jgi:chromosome segregation ATPase